MKTDKRGRPVTGAALSNAERQKAYRERVKNELLALRSTANPTPAPVAVTETVSNDNELQTQLDTLRAELKSTQQLYDSSVSARGELLKENRRLSAELEAITIERNRYKSRAETAESALGDENRGFKQDLDRERKEATRLFKENAQLKIQLEKFKKA